MKWSVIAVAVAFSACSLVPEKPRVTALDLERASTLPGIPIGIVARIEGKGALPRYGAFRVRPQLSKEFFAGSYLDGLPPTFNPENFEEGSHAAGNRRLEFPAGYLATSMLFSDSRVNWPGTYGLQLVLSDFQDLSPIAFGSQEIEFVVAKPEGADDEVWNAMLGRHLEWSSSSWSSFRSVANLVWSEYPDSSYAQYVILYVQQTDYDKMAAFWDSCLRKYPATPIADWVRFEKAKLLEQKSLHEILKNDDVRNVKAAIEYADQARALYMQVGRETSWGEIRRLVAERLRGLPTANMLQKQDRQRRQWAKPRE